MHTILFLDNNRHIHDQSECHPKTKATNERLCFLETANPDSQRKSYDVSQRTVIRYLSTIMRCLSTIMRYLSTVMRYLSLYSAFTQHLLSISQHLLSFFGGSAVPSILLWMFLIVVCFESETFLCMFLSCVL